MKTIIKNLKELQKILKKEKISIRIGLETRGKQKVFGSIDEIIEVSRHVKNVVPVLDVAHIHARGNGCLKTIEDVELLFSKLKGL